MRSEPSMRQARLQRELADKITSFAPLDDIRILLACGAQVNEPVVQGLRPLHYAVYGNNRSCVQLLLIRGSNINALDEVGYSALHLSAEHGYFDLTQLLIQNQAQVSFSNPSAKELFPREYKSEEPLRLALKNGHYECARLLLENGADPNARYFSGPEICFLGPSESQAMELVLMYGANPNVYDREGWTPLMRACRNKMGLPAVTVLLEYGAYVNACALERQDLRTPLHYAILSGNLKTVQYLISQRARINMRRDYEKPSPLDVAVLRDLPEIVQCLLDADADPNAVHTYIGSPLHLACCSLLANQYQILELLLKAGADPNLCPQFEEGRIKSPFVEYFRAHENIDVRIVRLLLEYGGKVIMNSPLQDPRGMLRNLIRIHHQPEIFQMLLEAGQNFNLTAVERLSLPTSRRLELLSVATAPSPLQHLCRLALRQQLDPVTPDKILQLPLPSIVHKYLMYR